MPVFLDSNIFLYAAGMEHTYKKPCIDIIRAVAEGRLAANTSAEVVQEILYVLLRRDRVQDATRLCHNVLQLFPAMMPVTRDDMLRAASLAGELQDLPARDLVHLACMQNHGMNTIVSADKHFDEVAGITRVDPLEAGLG